MTAGARTHTGANGAAATEWHRPGWSRSLQLALGAIWLLDGVLQLQPVLFTAGPTGLSGMLHQAAAGNPSWIASSIGWNATIVGHHPLAANTTFAFIQIFLGLGISRRRTLKPALAASVAWSLAVWWFGEGLGGVLSGNGTPLAGGPGAVLFYGLLAVLLWPASRSDARPSAAGQLIGARAANVVWAATWALLSLLCVLGSGRAPNGIHDVISGVEPGEPGWLSGLDRHAASAVQGDGLSIAVVLAIICLAIAGGVYLHCLARRVTLVVAIVVSLAVWVVTQNFGMILPGGATDPSSGPLLVILALAFWPLSPVRAEEEHPEPPMVVLRTPELQMA
ncbi:MAG: hypothetical protein ACRD0Z_14390 [Acidimicrobiales bacterium]